MPEPTPPANTDHEDTAPAAGESCAGRELDRRAWTARELAALGLDGFPGTKRGFQLWLQERGVRCERRRVRGGDALVFRTPDLPPELQLALLQREPTTAVVDLDVAPAPAVDLAVACRDLVDLPTLSDAAQRRSAARAAAVRAYQRWCREHGRTPSTTLANLFAEAWKRGDVVVPDDVREELLSFSGRSLRKWGDRMIAEGAVGLAGRYVRPQRAIEKVPGMRDFAEALIGTWPALTGAKLHRYLADRFGDATPSKAACGRWLNDWKSNNKALHAQLLNPDAYRSKYIPAFGDASEAVKRLNELWELDDTRADVILSDGKRYTVLGCIDVFSRRLMLHIHPTASSEGVALLLRRALLEWGVPETIRTDRGSNYISRRTATLLASLDIRHDVLPAYQPDRKGFIEKALGDFSRDALSELPGFVGHNVAHRQAIEAQKSFAERKEKQRRDQGDKPIVKIGLTLEEFRAHCDAWCKSRNAKMHGALKMAPDIKAASYAGTVRRIPDERALDVLLMPIAGTRTVSKKGLRVNGGCYIAAELGEWVGEVVTCREDPINAGRIIVFTVDNRFICQAFDPDLVDVSREEITRAARAMQRGKVGAGRARLREVGRRSGLDPQTIAREIRTDRIAASVLPFPRPGVTHETGGLTEAGHAARADDAPKAPPRTEADARRAAEMQALAAQRRAEAARDPWADRRARVARGLAAWDALNAGAEIQETERAWFEHYETTPEFLSEIAAQRGVDIRRGHYHPIAARRAASA